MKNNKKIALLLVMGVVTMGYIANSIGAAKTKTPAITSKMINDKKATFDKFLNEGKLAEAQNIANELSKIEGQRNTADAMQTKLNLAQTAMTNKELEQLKNDLTLCQINNTNAKNKLDSDVKKLEESIEKLKKSNTKLTKDNQKGKDALKMIENMFINPFLDLISNPKHDLILKNLKNFENIDGLKDLLKEIFDTIYSVLNAINTECQVKNPSIENIKKEIKKLDLGVGSN